MHGVTQKRTFLFLQGPHGSFFHRLGQALVCEGHQALRINLNGGDRGDWPGPATDYRGCAARWPTFFARFVMQNAVTDLVLFGDCRPLHRAAHIVADSRDIRVWVLDEGYIRPDWVTLESGGVNGRSNLPSDPDWFLEIARDLPPFPGARPVPSSFTRRVRDTLRYHRRLQWQRWRFPGYRSHRPDSFIAEMIGWAKRYLFRWRADDCVHGVIAMLAPKSYFVFPLQLNSDYQIRTHSDFPEMASAIYVTLESFARMAPAETRLLVKQHPLDNGITHWEPVVQEQASMLGIADRVSFIDGGDIARIVAGARGVVTINSTVGTLAVGEGVPTITLGKAVYAIPGITHRGTLDSFWSAPTPPDPVLWDAFCRVLRERCLVRGGFGSDEGLALLVGEAVSRLTDARVMVRPA